MKTLEQTVNEGGLTVSLRKERGWGRDWRIEGNGRNLINAFSVMLLAPEPTLSLPGCTEKLNTGHYVIEFLPPASDGGNLLLYNLCLWMKVGEPLSGRLQVQPLCSMAERHSPGIAAQREAVMITQIGV